MPRVEITEIITGRDSAGVLYGLDGASVQVNVRGGSAATVYAAAAGGTTVPNPLTTNNGRLDGWLDEGSYDLVPTYGGVVGGTLAFEARAAYPSGATDGQILTYDATTNGAAWADSTAITAGLPWHIDIVAISNPATQTNWSTLLQNSSLVLGCRLESTGAQNAELGWDVTLAAGTWRVDVWGHTLTDSGITTVSLDGATIGTLDWYSNPAVANVAKSITGVTVAATGKKRLLFQVATKNASSTSYYGRLSMVTLTRTA